MGCITAVWIISRFLSGPVYSYHGYFRFGSGFMPVFVKFYGSLMVHGYGSEKSRVVTARFNRGLTAVMYRGFETVKSPDLFGYLCVLNLFGIFIFLFVQLLVPKYGVFFCDIFHHLFCTICETLQYQLQIPFYFLRTLF